MLNKAGLAQFDWSARLVKIPWQDMLARAPFWVSMGFVVLIAHGAAEMTWFLFSPKETGSSSIATGKGQQLKALAGQARLRSVVDQHMFGVAQQTKARAVTEAAPIDAPKTNLKLVLKGVFASNDPDKAMAIIADAAGKEKLYRKGGQVPGGATVHAVYPDRVILERNGRFETLYLPRQRLPENAVVARPLNTRASSQSNTRLSADTSRKLQDIKQMIKKDPQSLWKQVRIEPVIQDGKIQGYKLSHNDAQLMRSIGIQNTDVITAVNGYSLDDPAVLYELMSEFDTASEISLTVERNGGTEVLVIHM